MSQGSLRIGEVAKRTSLSVDTIRFYEKRGLLQPTGRSSGRFRLYSEEDLNRLNLIRRTQELGFTLQEIRQLVDFDVRHGCASVSQMLREKIAVVNEKIEFLRELKEKLSGKLEECERELAKPTPQRKCPVLNESSSPEHNNLSRCC